MLLPFSDDERLAAKSIFTSVEDPEPVPTFTVVPIFETSKALSALALPPSMRPYTVPVMSGLVFDDGKKS